MNDPPLACDGSSGALWRRCCFMAGWGHFPFCSLVSLAIHGALLGGLLLALGQVPTIHPPEPAGSGPFIIELIPEGTAMHAPVVRSPATALQRPISTSKMMPRPGEPDSLAPSIPATPVTAALPSAASSPTPIVGMGLPMGTGMSIPGRRQAFTPPGLHQGRDGTSMSDEHLQWDLSRQAAQQALLRQQAVERYVGQWVVQLRSVLSQIENLSCQLAEEVTCDPALPPEIQAIVEQGLRQLQALDPWQPLHRLVIADGAFRFDQEPRDHSAILTELPSDPAGTLSSAE